MSCANQSNYDLGDGVVLYGDFINPETGNYSDPIGEISCTVQKSDGTENKYTLSDPEMVKVSVGRYETSIVVDQAGTWFYRWAGVDAAQEEKSFYVKAGIVTAP